LAHGSAVAEEAAEAEAVGPVEGPAEEVAAEREVEEVVAEEVVAEEVVVGEVAAPPGCYRTQSLSRPATRSASSRRPGHW
jgi:hypothetical protein